MQSRRTRRSYSLAHSYSFILSALMTIRNIALFISRDPQLARCFFFSSRRRHTRSTRDWSSDVCSSDLRSLFTTPNVPPARLALLRAAFHKMLADPEFRAEAQQLNLPLATKSGEEMQKVVDRKSVV